MIEDLNPPHEESVKEPDACWEISGESAPSLVVEVGFYRPTRAAFVAWKWDEGGDAAERSHFNYRKRGW